MKNTNKEVGGGVVSAPVGAAPFVQSHIRHALRRMRGSQFYRDRNPRQTSTLCGAPVTEYDVLVTDRGLVHRVALYPSTYCPACRSALARKGA